MSALSGAVSDAGVRSSGLGWLMYYCTERVSEERKAVITEYLLTNDGLTRSDHDVCMNSGLVLM